MHRSRLTEDGYSVNILNDSYQRRTVMSIVIDVGLELWAAPFPLPFPDREHRYNVLTFQRRSLRLQTNFVSFHSAIVPGASYRKIVWYEKGVEHIGWFGIDITNDDSISTPVSTRGFCIYFLGLD